MKTHPFIPRIARSVLGLLLSTVVALAASANSPKLHRAAKPIKNQYVVVLKDTLATADVESVAGALAKVHSGKIRHRYKHALRGFSVNLTEKQAIALSEDPRVASVEEDRIGSICSVQYSPTWGLDRIDQRNASLSNSFDNANLTGAGVTVYVLDTGIRTTHQEFSGRAYVGADFINDGLNGQDGNGHGTHVAGTVGGQTYGVAKGASLCSVRVLDSGGYTSVSQVIAGVDWVTANHTNPAVANMSLRFYEVVPSLDQAVRNSIASGVTYVLAAGNENADANGYSPARVQEGINVSATDTNDARASFANYGPTVDVFAPGVSITSAWHASDTATNTIPGTSMAAPHVAGVAALYLQSQPAASPDTVAAAVLNCASTDKVTNPNGSANRLLFLNDGWSPSHPKYRIVSVHSGQVLDVTGDSMNPGTRICQWPYVGVDSQHWRLIDVGGGAKKIISVMTGLALDVDGDSQTQGAHILQWPYVDVPSQQWMLVDVGGGAYTIAAVHSGQVLDVEGDSVNPGTYICQWPYVGVVSQQWRLESVP